VVFRGIRGFGVALGCRRQLGGNITAAEIEILGTHAFGEGHGHLGRGDRVWDRLGTIDEVLGVLAQQLKLDERRHEIFQKQRRIVNIPG
jgi:hypothetical protein